MNKVLVLIRDCAVYSRVKSALESAGFKAEQGLAEQYNCRAVILDYFYLHAGITADLISNRPLYLLLQQSEMHAPSSRFNGLFSDVWVIPEGETEESTVVVSALKGEAKLQSLFESWSKTGKQREQRGAGRKSEPAFL